MEKLYNDDVNISVLTAQMEILRVLLKDGDYFCFDDIIVKIKELPNPEREIIKEVSDGEFSDPIAIRLLYIMLAFFRAF